MGGRRSRDSDAREIRASLTRPERFETVFHRHHAAVRAYLHRRVGPEPADDLASATFVVAFERRAGFRADADSARPWLLGIATNLLRNEWRAEQRALAGLAALRASVAVGIEAKAVDQTDLAAALAALEPDQRDVLLLHAWEELTYAEIAAALDVPVGTVRSRMSRACARLRAALATEQEQEVP